MIINKVVIHELIKEQRSEIQNSRIKDTVLDTQSEAVKKLVDGIISLYGKRHNTAHYGTFQTNEARGTFPDQFEAYASINTPDNNDFLALTKGAMTALYTKAAEQNLASGGYILFADYSTEQHRYFLMAMIKQKDGLTLSDNLVPEELTELDLRRLYQAARINFSRLSMFLATEDERARLDLSYLSFVSPATGRSTAGYFVTALGCAKGAASARATDNLIKESSNFFRNNESLRGHLRDFRSNLLTYLEIKKETGESVKLSEVEELARPYMPAEQPGQVDDLADAFITHLNSEDCAVPVEFPVNNPTLLKYTHIKYKADNWEIKFERGALGNDDSAQIYYDQRSNRIIINNIPRDAADVIRQELENRRKVE